MNGTYVSEINVIVSTAACILSLIIAFNVWRRRSHQEGADWFVALILSVSWLSFFYALDAAAGYDIQAYVNSTKLEYISFTLMPVFWLGFALAISGHERPFSPRLFMALLIIPFLTMILAFTNEWHGLIWQQARFDNMPYGPVFAPFYGRWFWVHVLYTYSLFFAGTVVLIRRAIGTWRLYRKQTLLILFGATFPWLSNFLEIFDQFNPLPELYLNSICMLVGIIAFAAGVFRMHLLDIVPFTQDAILNNMPVGYLVTDTQHQIVAFNKMVRPFLNNPDAIGKPLLSLLPTFPVDAINRMQPCRWNFEDRIVEVTVTPMLNWRRSPRGSLYVLNDVTTRVQAEEALRTSEARQRALLKAMPDLMFRLRQDGTFVDYHAPSPDDLIMPPEVFLGRRVHELMPEIIADEEMRLIDQVVATGGMESFEYVMDMNGVPVNFEARIVASGSDEVVFIVRNITEHKQAEQRAFALALEKERVSLLTRFIQDSSHEFRTPLSIIEVSAHLLRKLTDSDKREQRIAQIELQVERITHLVDMLVQMSRLDSGAPLSLRSTNPNSIVEQVAINMHTNATERRLSIRRDFTEPIPAVDADGKQLLEALTQIVDNALRYAQPPEGAEGEIVLRTRCDDRHIRITVEDTGVGIPEDALPHLFERFYRFDSAHSTPGFGLGLAIAHKIVELHGGTIEVESTVGVGSRFTLVLPHMGMGTREKPQIMETAAP